MEQKMRKEEEMRKFEEEKKRIKNAKREEKEKQFLEEIRQAEEEVRRLEALKAEEVQRYEKIKTETEELKRKSYKEATPTTPTPNVSANVSTFQEINSTQQTASEITEVTLSSEISVNSTEQEKAHNSQENMEPIEIQAKEESHPVSDSTSSPQEEVINTKGRISQFQRSGSFTKSFTKTADLEMPQEFKAGIRGKVAESKQSYLKQVSTDNNEQEKMSRLQELENIRMSRARQEQESEDAESKDKHIREEKMRELEEIKRARSHSRQRQEQTVLENSYSQEKESRANELAQLANRKTNFSWELEDKEAQLREARAQELKMLSSRQTGQDWEPENKEQAIREERAKELAEVANRKVEIDWDSQSREYVLKQQRCEELAEIADLRANTTWDSSGRPVDTSHSAEDKEMATISGIGSDTIVTNSEQQKATQISDSEMRSRVRSTKEAWQQKEKSVSCERVSSRSKDVPTRSIGNRFNKNSEFWIDTADNEDFPEPPSEAEISASESLISAPPPLAPRQSSKTVVKEYIQSGSDPNWSAPWRK